MSAVFLYPNVSFRPEAEPETRKLAYVPSSPIRASMNVHHSSDSREGTSGLPRIPSLNSTTDRHSIDPVSGPWPSGSPVCSRDSTYCCHRSEQGSGALSRVCSPAQADAITIWRRITSLITDRIASVLDGSPAEIIPQIRRREPCRRNAAAHLRFIPLAQHGRTQASGSIVFSQYLPRTSFERL